MSAECSLPLFLSGQLPHNKWVQTSGIAPCYPLQEPRAHHQLSLLQSPLLKLVTRSVQPTCKKEGVQEGRWTWHRVHCVFKELQRLQSSSPCGRTHMFTLPLILVSLKWESFFFFSPFQLISLWRHFKLNCKEVPTIPEKRSDILMLTLDGCIQAASFKLVTPTWLVIKDQPTEV